ncbi:cholesterol 24-hydroxylase-like [Anomaloglossus baeobatrachus]
MDESGFGKYEENVTCLTSLCPLYSSVEEENAMWLLFTSAQDIFGQLLSPILNGYIYYIHMKYDHIPGPPRDSFFLGHLPSILRVLENNGLVHDLFLHWVQTYGPVVRMNTFHNVKILLCSPEGIKEILMSPKYKKDAEYRHAHSLFGERLLLVWSWGVTH